MLVNIRVEFEVKVDFVELARKAEAEFDEQWGNSIFTRFIDDTFVCEYMSCKGNSAMIVLRENDVVVGLDGTRHGAFAALRELCSRTGFQFDELFNSLKNNGEVIKYETSQPSFLWWETAKDAAQRGDANAAAISAKREAEGYPLW